MDDLPRQKLRELIVEYGRSLCDDPRRCEALLKDYCGQYKREIFVLVNALKNRVADELINASAGVPPALLWARLIQRLEDELAFSEAVARWAVESWALALEPPASSSSLLKPFTVFRDRLRDGGEGPAMIAIPAGEFWMGSPEDEEGRNRDERRHRVKVERPFAIGRYAVTFDQYDRFCVATQRQQPHDRGWGRGNRPAINVSWSDAVDYTEWLSAQTDRAYRLPTEAEWEYAARAGTETAFWWGDSITTDQANYDGNYTYRSGRKGVNREKTVPVDQFQPNPWGLYQVHGNVSEWTGSCYDKNYGGAERWCVGKGGFGPLAVRGGSWYYSPAWVRSAIRDGSVPTFRGNTRGFRLARFL